MTWWRGWPPLLLLPAAVLVAPTSWPRWAVMWTLAFTIFCGCKWLTWRRTPVAGVPAWKHAAYLLAWPGLDPAAFLTGRADPPASAEWLRGCRNAVGGVALLFGVARFVAARSPYAAGWIGMTGMILILHFGLLHLLSCWWRRAGVDAKPLMNMPIRSTSLGEFWGRRWNTAFRDLTHRFLFRPLTRRLGVRAGLAAGFLFSGLVHELVISVPAGGGYGGPTVFFAIQGLAIVFERSRFARTIGLDDGRRGWIFTMLVLVIPAPGLFHPPFVERIILPFMQALETL